MMNSFTDNDFALSGTLSHRLTLLMNSFTDNDFALFATFIIQTNNAV